MLDTIGNGPVALLFIDADCINMYSLGRDWITYLCMAAGWREVESMAGRNGGVAAMPGALVPRPSKHAMRSLGAHMRR